MKKQTVKTKITKTAQLKVKKTSLTYSSSTTEGGGGVETLA